MTSLNQGPKTLSYSPTENAILVCSALEGGSYELYIIPKDSFGRGDTIQEAKRGLGGSVTKSPLPFPTDAIFYAGTGNLLCRADDRVVIFDLQQRIILGDLQ